MTMAAILLCGSVLQGQEGTLQTIRDDVRQGSPGSASPSPAPPSERRTYDPQNESLDELEYSLFTLAFYGASVVATAPISLPIILLDDDLVPWGGFAQFPYDQTPGYILANDPAIAPRSWAGRLDVEWAESFDQLDQIGAHMLLETATRFGVDLRAKHLQERLDAGTRDQLWLGDCNLTFRFAQTARVQFRAGLGFNWLTDDARTDLGFNFVYGADFFPRKPWVLSAVLDAGTLGHAGLFRFQTTAGVMVNRLELYTGYEYADIGRTQWNALIGGIRLWF
jgi:hypothetical protein